MERMAMAENEAQDNMWENHFLTVAPDGAKGCSHECSEAQLVENEFFSARPGWDEGDRPAVAVKSILIWV
jgi:hypothetical protein